MEETFLGRESKMLDYEELHALSFENEKLVKSSNTCGCFYCGKIFKSTEVIDWCVDANARTAICPYCGIDSVLQESLDGSYQLNKDLLFDMNQRWFGGHGFSSD